MKPTLIISVIIASAIMHNTVTIYAAPVQSSIKYNATDERTDIQWDAYDDSVYSAMYPHAVLCYLDTTKLNKTVSSTLPSQIQPILSDSHVVTSREIDKSKAVGEIPIMSGATPTGAKTYNIPIEVYPGINGLQPDLSLTYSSNQNGSYLGKGWEISGLSLIERVNKTIYYDDEVDGVSMSVNDVFTIDGIRLIRTGSTNSEIMYESTVNNIRAIGHYNDSIITHFDVLYPDGKKGVFGMPSAQNNSVEYPITSLFDLKGNEIHYEYTLYGGRYYIFKISYNSVSVSFQYEYLGEGIAQYRSGLSLYNNYLLKSIQCKYESTEIRKYSLSYEPYYSDFLLKEIGCSAQNESYNPLQFYYGTGDLSEGYRTTDTQLIVAFRPEDYDKINVTCGRFDNETGLDGLILYENRNPYWKHYHHKMTFKHSQERFYNYFTGKEKILIYAGLSNDFASPMPELLTEDSFIDILCADIKGSQNDNIIKINNFVEGDNDHVVFKVYTSTSMGLFNQYTRTYDFNTVFVDKSGWKSVHPKFYHSGDFDGDGKMEILAISVHEPFGREDKPSMCYVFDLENDTILFQGHVMPYNVDFVGSHQQDPVDAANKTDKILILDYDGDGKTDICHIDDSGMHIYSFIIGNNGWNAKETSSNSDICNEALKNSQILAGDFNGDGLIDILKSPSFENKGDTNWTIYNSMGNGRFTINRFSGPTYDGSSSTQFIIQDVNGDGISDLIAKNNGNIDTYLFGDRKTINKVEHSICDSTALFVSVNINSKNINPQLVSVNGLIATIHKYTRDDYRESLITGMANSYGVIEHNDYRLMTATSYDRPIYTGGERAAYPYYNFKEPLWLLSSTTKYCKSQTVDNVSYYYGNAIAHRQGLGFIGFEKYSIVDKRGKCRTQTFDPYNLSVPKSDISPEHEVSYTFDVIVSPEKLTKILLSSKTEKDIKTGVCSSTVYQYDSFGNPTSQCASFSDGIIVNRENSYYNNNDYSPRYIVGYLTGQTTTSQRGSLTYSEAWKYPAYTPQYPNVKLYYKNGTVVLTEIFDYDNKGNILKKGTKNFSSNTLYSTYKYDSFGRVISETDPSGLAKQYIYDRNGKLQKIIDERDNTISFTYDNFGREVCVVNTDSTNVSTNYAWANDVSEALYYIKTVTSGKPTKTNYYDNFSRLVRNSEIRFDGSVLKTDRKYDDYGNLKAVSLPFKRSEASLWNVYEYDSFNRPVSYIEASGKKTLYSYENNTITTTESGIATTKRYDSLGNITSITDPGGTVNYDLDADGQVLRIVAPGGITTHLSYDGARRRITLDDPSLGKISTEYDAAGNISKETDGNGKSRTMEYDDFNRLTKVVTPEFTSTYSYNLFGDILSVSSSNGTSKNYIYDKTGRVVREIENSTDSVFLRKDYTYKDGNVSSVKYITHSGFSVMEEKRYSNGFLSDILADGESIFSMFEENDLGQPQIVLTTDKIEHYYDYCPYGILLEKYVNFNTTPNCVIDTYDFDPDSGNLLERIYTDDYSEEYEYDNLNRLISYSDNTVSYDSKGNITSKSDAGSFSYNISSKPYAISAADVQAGSDQTSSRNITYTSFSRPNTISASLDGYADISYNSDYDRVKTSFHMKNTGEMTRYYLGGCYEYEIKSRKVPKKTPVLVDSLPIINIDTTDKRERIYIGGDYYTAPICFVYNGKTKQRYNIIRNHIGSITHVIDSTGVIVQHIDYDPWGRLRDPNTHELYAKGKEPELFLSRGYTGHEHLPMFGLINMNSRLYDPTLGRFLSPDPYIQAPELTQNFNRYSYALNNPLKYNDVSGEFFLIFSALFDLSENIFSHGFNISRYRFNKSKNALKIYKGMFQGSPLQVVNKFTWGFVNSIIGLSMAQYCNLFHSVEVTEFDGMVAIGGVTGKGTRAATVGHYSIGPDNYTADWRDHMFVHEYGHYIQSQFLGPFYPFVVAGPSLLSASMTSGWSNRKHDDRWFERNANYLAAKHFHKKYGGDGGNSRNSFDKNAFLTNSSSSYRNPRDGSHNYNAYPDGSVSLVFWDFIF